MYEAIHLTLQKIAKNQQDWDSKSMTEASGLLNTITTPGFIVAFNVNLYIFGFTKVFSKLLQGSSRDILTAYEEVHLVKEELEAVHADADKCFEEIFAKYMAMGQKAGLQSLDPPLRCGRLRETMLMLRMQKSIGEGPFSFHFWMTCVTNLIPDLYPYQNKPSSVCTIMLWYRNAKC